jgi:hypothetical protein
MSSMNCEVYEALKAISAPDGNAAAAASPTSKDRFVKLEGKVDKLVWVVGFNLVIAPGLRIAMLNAWSTPPMRLGRDLPSANLYLPIRLICRSLASTRLTSIRRQQPTWNRARLRCYPCN